MKTRMLLALTVLAGLVLSGCANEAINESVPLRELETEAEEQAITAEYEPATEPIVYQAILAAQTAAPMPVTSVSGVITNFTGTVNEDGSVPWYVDLLRFDIVKDCGKEVVILAMFRAGFNFDRVPHAGMRITAYISVRAENFVYEKPMYTAWRVVADDMPATAEIVRGASVPIYRYPSYPIDMELAFLGHVRLISNFAVVDLPIYLHGERMDISPAIMAADGTVMVPLRPLLSDPPQTTRISLEGKLYLGFGDAGGPESRSGARTWEVGNTGVQGGIRSLGNVHLCTPPIIVNGIIYIPMVSARFEGSIIAVMYEDRIEVERESWDLWGSHNNVFSAEENELTELAIVANGIVIDAPRVIFDTNRRFFTVQSYLVPAMPIFEALGYGFISWGSSHEYDDWWFHNYVFPEIEVRHWSDRSDHDFLASGQNIVVNELDEIIMFNFRFLHVVIDGEKYIQVDRAFDYVIYDGQIFISSRGRK